MSIMDTGGTGFIGSKIARKLVERGEVTVIFDLAPPRANLEPYLDRIQVHRGDITQVPHLLEAVNTHGATRSFTWRPYCPRTPKTGPTSGCLSTSRGPTAFLR